MGMILFAVLHRAIVVIYYIILNNDFQKYSFGATEGTLQAVDFFSLLIALFFGGWYGTALGLHWYRLVYEEKAWTGLFHAFVPHHWREQKSNGKVDAITRSSSSKSANASGFEALKTMKQPERPMAWDFDDLKAMETPKRKPRVAAKVTRPRKPAVAKAVVRKPRVKVTETIAE